MAWSISNAMMRNYESLSYSRERGGASLPTNYSDGEPSALSNTTPMPDQYYWPDRTTEHSRLSRFGMTCERLTEKPWRGIVDMVSGGFPCTNISASGDGSGIDGEASGLWGEMRRVIGDVQPRYVRVENGPMLTSRGLGRVLGDLAAMGFDAEWGCLSGGSFGANHVRDRIWIIATHSDVPQLERRSISSRIYKEYTNLGHSCWWENPPELHRMDDAVAFGLDRLKAIGNGQIPVVAATAWRILSGEP